MKRKSHNVEWDRISKYLSGEMSEAEKTDFESLMGSNPEYAQIVSASGKDLGLISKTGNQNQFDVDPAWKNVKSRIKVTEPTQTKKNTPTIPVFGWRRVVQLAAMVVIVVGAGLISHQVYINNFAPYKNFVSQINETGKSIVLADGSKITLNGESKLIFPREFKGNERRVQLTGEAFFDIAKNPERPFIISLKSAEVKVLGTSFNVKTSNGYAEVLVETGKVQFSSISNPGNHVVLEKGDFAVLEKNILEKTSMNDENYLSWKTQKMIFKGMGLKAVARVIDRTYQVQIQFEDPEIMDHTINTTFDHTPLDVVLENLCRPFNLAYEKNGNQIIIKRDLK